jgi:hypothetical protein
MPKRAPSERRAAIEALRPRPIAETNLMTRLVLEQTYPGPPGSSSWTTVHGTSSDENDAEFYWTIFCTFVSVKDNMKTIQARTVQPSLGVFMWNADAEEIMYEDHRSITISALETLSKQAKPQSKRCSPTVWRLPFIEELV